ncbi:MAG: DUF1587 domain-containing protein, partial [Myxococcales bacterium]|nr:DUF1587 domain-containing protein [Myxococcales bacterium]
MGSPFPARGVLASALLAGFGACHAGAPAGSDAATTTTGTTGGGAPEGGGTTGDELPPDAGFEVGVSGLRRLSIVEYQQTIADLLGIDVPSAKELLPQDTLTPFDNDFTLQTASEPLIKGMELLA